ncbi:hypothetical protein AGMMS50262_12000 [Bacteroidia bacterium]|nr:hypothetical protein AGMMS50262_12000 [Bacteroidia bacterium]
MLFLAVFQSRAQALPFQDNEELGYTIYYKYGLLMMNGGSARYTLDFTTYNHQKAVKSVLSFKTNSFFDKIFKIRDTLNAYASLPELKPLYLNRSVNEGPTHFQEELLMRKHDNSYSEMNVKRIKNGEIRIDTLLSVNNLSYDILNIFLFVRNVDYLAWNIGQTCNITAFLGTESVNIIMRYRGQTVLEKSETLKYKALLWEVDITDKVFSEAKNAMEMWVSDDENHVPLKLRAKLKIGAAEAELTSYKRLKHPLTSKIKLNPRK